MGKRSKNAEMEREIVELRRQLAVQASPIAPHATVNKAPTSSSHSPNISQIPSTLDQYMGSQEAVASLLDLRSGLDGGSYLRSPNGQMVPPKRLENVVLVHDRVQELFRQYVLSHLWPVRKIVDQNVQFLHLLPSFPSTPRTGQILRRLL